MTATKIQASDDPYYNLRGGGISNELRFSRHSANREEESNAVRKYT